jgi:hypothetical protein
MGQLQPMPSPPDGPAAPGEPASVIAMEPLRCSLCGASLKGHRLKFRMVSPRASAPVTLCNTCHKAALGEGYRLAR